MPSAPAARLPAAPLLELFHGMYDHVIADACAVSMRSIVRWRKEGIPWTTADRICAHLGVHPRQVWAEGWDDLIEES